MIEIEIPVKKSADAADLAYPRYATAGASGVDLLAAVKEPLVVRPFEIVLVPTGLTLAIPEGYEGQVRPRSGLALKNGVTLVNSPGTIDADYRGEVGVILTVVKNVPFTIERGMRIAQLVFAPVVRGVFTPTEHLGDTPRGAGGFGHTGSG